MTSWTWLDVISYKKNNNKLPNYIIIYTREIFIQLNSQTRRIFIILTMLGFLTKTNWGRSNIGWSLRSGSITGLIRMPFCFTVIAEICITTWSFTFYFRATGTASCYHSKTTIRCWTPTSIRINCQHSPHHKIFILLILCRVIQYATDFYKKKSIKFVILYKLIFNWGNDFLTLRTFFWILNYIF